MRSIFNASVPLANVIVLPVINNRVGSFHATKNDETLSFAMSQNETEPGSGLYGWGENHRIKVLSFTNDNLLCSGRLIPNITQREQVKTMYLDQLNTRWSNFKAAVNAPNIRDEARQRATDVLEAFEALHTKEGAIVEPDWESAVVAIEGHHRLLGHCLELAYTYCKAEGKIFSMEIPVSCVAFDDLLELRLAQTMGNGASAAHNPLNDLDLVGMAVDFCLTKSETEFRFLTGKDNGSTGRRAYAIGKLHRICEHKGIDVFGALKLFYNTKAEQGDDVARKTAGAVPLEALHNDVKDRWGNVPSILRLIGSLKELDAYVAKKNSVVNEWEAAAHASRQLWSDDRLREWWKSRQPAAEGNNGLIVSDRTIEPKANKDFIRVCESGLMGEVGKMFGSLVYKSNEQRETDKDQMFLTANGVAVNAGVLLLKNASTGPVYREFVTELEAVSQAVPEQVASLIADFRDQLRQTASKAAAETTEVDAAKVDTAPTTDSANQTETGKPAKGKAKAK